MWLHNLTRLGHFLRRIRLCRELFDAGGVDLVVLVDFGGFNLYVARAAARAGIRVLYYIVPQMWAHGLYRVKKLRRWVTRALVIYPFEPDMYARYRLEAEYIGHPLFDRIAQQEPTPEQTRSLREQIGGRPVALFPGSRAQEVRAHMPVLREACARLRRDVPEVRYAAVCPERMRPLVEEQLADCDLDVRLLEVAPLHLAQAADLCLTKSGTITLEIASQLTPCVIFYRMHPFAYFLGLGVANVEYAGLVNNLAGRMVCPEKVMWRPDASWLHREALALLTDPGRRAQCRRGIEEVMQSFAKPGATARAADVVLELLDEG